MINSFVARLRRAAALTAAACVVIAVAGCAGPQAKYKIPAAAPVQTAAIKTPPPPAEPDWRRYFRDMSNGAILVSLDDRRLSYWAPGAQSYREFPIAVPRSPDLERRGRTEIVRRRKNPSWRPTPAMLKRNPRLPKYVGPGPHNPLGERALYLGWRYYAIHGTNDPRSIGRAATSGCFRMFPKHIAWLYDRAPLGLPVRVVEDLPGRAPLRVVVGEGQTIPQARPLPGPASAPLTTAPALAARGNGQVASAANVASRADGAR